MSHPGCTLGCRTNVVERGGAVALTARCCLRYCRTPDLKSSKASRAVAPKAWILSFQAQAAKLAPKSRRPSSTP